MTIILRLVGLDVKAGTEDIRKFFESLYIPDGGVYIVGGSLQEAFIAFNTEKEAELAMRRSGMFLKGSPVAIHMSSMEELEHKLEALLKRRKKSSPPSATRPQPQPAATLTSLKTQSLEHNTANFSPPTACSVDPDAANVPHLNAQDLCSTTTNVQSPNTPPLDSSTAFLLGVCTVLQGLQSNQRGDICNLLPNIDFLKANARVPEPNEVNSPDRTQEARPGYVRLFGLPATTTKEDICHFFKGLTVCEAVTNVNLGHNFGCLVKFASIQDACDARGFNQQLFGSACVEVRSASEKLWNSVLQECEDAVTVLEAPKQNSQEESENLKLDRQIKRTYSDQLPSRPPKKTKLEPTTKFPVMEQIVMVSKLPKTMTKTEIKELFGCTTLSHKNVLHLLDKESNRTDTAFLIFHRTEDYDYAMNLSGCHVGSSAIEVLSITKEKMREMIAKNRCRTHRRIFSNTRKKPKGKTLNKFAETQTVELDPAAKTCLFIRNLPAEVQKSQIKSLFYKYQVKKENITILHDIDGIGIGEAVVKFNSTKLAQLAEEIHGEIFLGSKLLLTLITAKQMEDILGKHIEGH